MPAKFTASLPAGVRVTVESPGGGGWGKRGQARARRSSERRSRARI